ncbi:hypothetical protein [Sphingobacterium rhinopitheci]|uniref:hypothetical protein n=1 Tax=Sphingobacterium rhinopitheci TaxID=2781960 RepID=UPI001F52265E|nr:hypothetical protein [Sphingobacterium rhinopitheci]MCI0922732.1 hypothetical protein [Sphingobacterium rhinopitheci]
MAKNRLANLSERNSQTTKTAKFVDNMYSDQEETLKPKQDLDLRSNNLGINKPKNNKHKKDKGEDDNYKNFLFPLKKEYHYYLKHIIAPQKGLPMYEILEKALEEVYPDIKNFKP